MGIFEIIFMLTVHSEAKSTSSSEDCSADYNLAWTSVYCGIHNPYLSHHPIQLHCRRKLWVPPPAEQEHFRNWIWHNASQGMLVMPLPGLPSRYLQAYSAFLPLLYDHSFDIFAAFFQARTCHRSLRMGTPSNLAPREDHKSLGVIRISKVQEVVLSEGAVWCQWWSYQQSLRQQKSAPIQAFVRNSSVCLSIN